MSASPLTRFFLVIFGFLGLAVGITLFFLSEQTATYFAWTVQPPLSAAILGAGYLSSILIAPLALRERYWSRSQVSFIGFLPGLALIMLATFVHLDKFHFNNPQAAALPRMLAYLWVGGYLLITLAMVVMLYLQMRNAPAENPPISPLPAWLKLLFALVALVALGISSILVINPETLIPVWPWKISAFIGRMLGAFLAAQGASGVLAIWANDRYKIKIMCAGYVLFISLQIVALLRYGTVYNTASPGGLAYLALLGLILITGLLGLWQANLKQQP